MQTKGKTLASIARKSYKMTTQKIYLSLFLLLLYGIFISCSSQNKFKDRDALIGKRFTSKTENRKLVIEIVDAENLKIINEFDCENIDEKFRKVVFEKKYHRSGKSIILNDSIFNFKLPYFDSSNCEFLSEKYRTQKNERSFDGRLIVLNRKELYSMWNIDTLKIVENKLIYFKRNSLGSHGFMFE
jgi:hypothetical protein